MGKWMLFRQDHLAYSFLLSSPGCPTPQAILVYSGSGENNNFCRHPVPFHLLWIKVKDQEILNCIRAFYCWEKKMWECFQKEKISILTESFQDKGVNLNIFSGENSGLEFQSWLWGCQRLRQPRILLTLHIVYCLTRDIQILTCFCSYCIPFLFWWDITRLRHQCTALLLYLIDLMTSIHKRTQNEPEPTQSIQNIHFSVLQKLFILSLLPSSAKRTQHVINQSSIHRRTSGLILQCISPAQTHISTYKQLQGLFYFLVTFSK